MASDAKIENDPLLLHLDKRFYRSTFGKNGVQWERCQDDDTKPTFQKADFAAMQEWWFNFARLPSSLF